MSGSNFIPLSAIQPPSQTAAGGNKPPGFIPLAAVQPPSDTGAPSHLARFGAELMQPVIGLGQLASRIPLRGVNPLQPGEVDSLARENQSTIDRARQAEGSTGFNWEQLGADVANPINYLGGELASALGIGKGLAGPVSGALSGLTQPVTSGNFWKQKAGQAALGGVAGGASDMATRAVGGVVAPAMRESAKILSDLGIRLTPGQMAGGVTKSTEDKATSIPLVGDAIHAARVQSIHDFNRAVINQGLSEIGQVIPRTVKAGHDAINYMHDAVTRELDRVTSGMRAGIDKDFANDMTNTLNLARNLPDDMYQKFRRFVMTQVAPEFSQGGKISGEAAQKLGTKIDNQVNAMKISPDPDVRQMGNAMKEVDAALNRLMARQNPALAEQKERADAAYAHYKTVELAGSSLGANKGVFTPAHLLHAIKNRDRSKDKASFARGNAMMQELGERAKEVLPSDVPDSGTAGRGAILAAPGLAAFATQRPLQAAGIASAVGAGRGLYSKPGLALARKVANPGASRKAVRAALKAVAPRTAPAAAQAALGVAPPLMPGEFGGPQ